MELIVYKGFDVSFLSNVHFKPLIISDLSRRKDIFSFDKAYSKQLQIGLLSLEESDTVWATYEELSLISKVIDGFIADGLKVTVIKNNIYPDYYPIDVPISRELAKEIWDVLNGDKTGPVSDECNSFTQIYNNLVDADGQFFGCFYNFETELTDISVQEYYPQNAIIHEDIESINYEVFLNEDIDTYLRDLVRITKQRPKVVSFRSTNGLVAQRALKSLQALSIQFNFQITSYHEKLPEESAFEEELVNIAKKDLNIEGFEEFRQIRFYKNPDTGNETVDLSQAQLIREIITQAERSYNLEDSYRDVFITASTGAGKSVIFQIPAVYLAKKYGKLTIIIEPVKALMQDQKEKLNKAGYNRVEYFNSDLITQVEKEAVLKKIKAGDVDLLYLSPETLLSYSIETIIGEREIGLIIIDEAHIVTTWGVGFRPDYWYLGNYLNRLRNQMNSRIERKLYHFPICAFTATAINGGLDDSVGETIISLYMENPIKYIGYVKRDDISFDIAHPMEGITLSVNDYEQEKCKALDKRMREWLSNGEKTIIYFPYAKLVSNASKGMNPFGGIITDKRIGSYTGKNVEELSNEAFNDVKRTTFDAFRNGSKLIMMATKAFGMGIDVNDVKNVYHYAVSGNLSDYVQEIGRSARKKEMQGNAITDYFYHDMKYMNALFGMSQIKQYQIKKVLEGVYNTYKVRGHRNFLISPESFTYIFNDKDESKSINKLKTCLMMLEKDMYDKFNFKVIISRPQSVFTKAYICVKKEYEKEVLSSQYGKYMRFAAKGRNKETDSNGVLISDTGDIYTIELKNIWEDHYENISFPQFKYWFFNYNVKSKDKIDIMPSIRNYIAPRQKLVVEAKGELSLSDIREQIMLDFDYIADQLYKELKGKYFTTEEFANVLSERFGKTKARIISNTIFDLVDSDRKCVKNRSNDISGRSEYFVSHGNFKEFLKKPINRAKIMSFLNRERGSATYTGYISLTTDDSSMKALKLLSIFDYISYEVAGGEEPEIFIRLNDPEKVKGIIMGNIQYTNGYVTRANHKHERDVAVLRRFFTGLTSDEDRWNYIEQYFLGADVLEGIEITETKTVSMSRSIDKEHSYNAKMHESWDDLKVFFDDSDWSVLEKLNEAGIILPEYLETAFKKSDEGKDVLMSWPSKNALICVQDTSDSTLMYFNKKGWTAYRFYEIEIDSLKEALK